MNDPLDYPFLDYKGIMEALGDVCKKDTAYAIMNAVSYTHLDVYKRQECKQRF